MMWEQWLAQSEARLDYFWASHACKLEIGSFIEWGIKNSKRGFKTFNKRRFLSEVRNLVINLPFETLLTSFKTLGLHLLILILSYLIFLEQLEPPHVVYHQRVDVEEEKLLHGLFPEMQIHNHHYYLFEEM